MFKALTSHIWSSELAQRPLENGVHGLEVESAPLILCICECLLPRQILVISTGITEVMGKSWLLDVVWSTDAWPG